MLTTEPGASQLAGRRILIASMYYAPESSGSAPYTTDLAEHLARRGAHVEVITTHPHYPQWHRAPGTSNLWAKEVRAGVTVWRMPGYVPADPTVLRRFLYESSYIAASAKRLAARRPDVIIGCSPAVFAAGLAAATARLRDVPLVQWVQDVVSAAAQQSGVAAGGHATRMITRLESAALSQASGIAVPSEAFAGTVTRLTGGEVPVRIVPNWSRLPDGTNIDGDARTGQVRLGRAHGGAAHGQHRTQAGLGRVGPAPARHGQDPSAHPVCLRR